MSHSFGLETPELTCRGTAAEWTDSWVVPTIPPDRILEGNRIAVAEEPVQRRLAAILAADVVGYSRLMEQDEAGTVAVLKARRKDILQPLVAKHRGRVVKLMGDGVLVEFASAVSAVACAAELQDAMHAANTGAPAD